MPGVTQRKYIGELMRFNKSLKRPLNLILEVLPYDYNFNDILELFKELYPFEWKTIEQRYNVYSQKDKHLKSVGKKNRYKPQPPNVYLKSLPKIKNMLSNGVKSVHKNSFDEENKNRQLEILRKKRNNSITRKQNEINRIKQNIQEIEPEFIDIFINAYHQKGILTEGKLEILNELKKYECKKTLEFFYKINDAERNDQVREEAFNYLQKTGNYVKLRKKFKGKQKSYMTEEFNFSMTPEDLVKRLEEKSVQNLKKYDFFISHSYKDSKLVLEIKNILNEKGYVVYYDWSSDNDFLKRNLVSEYTEIVLKKRITQSNKILFLRTTNTLNDDNEFLSKWVKMEIDYANKIRKEIVAIDFIKDEKCQFDTINYKSDIKYLYLENKSKTISN